MPRSILAIRRDSEWIALTSSGDNFGGADRDRTGGLLVANQALSQLSYSPLLAFSHQVKQIYLMADD
jgi:hypothetical protein